MKELLNRFENKAPEIVFEWHDAETPAKGWVVINSLRGGAAGGGTRMRPGLDRREVESLAKTMEVKFSVSGPAIGGAKSGIDFDPADPRKNDVLRRWYKAVTPLLKSYYGTGGDLNIDEVHEVIPITESYGLWHPQEGVVNGHFAPSDSERIQKVGQLRMGVAKVVEDRSYSPDITRKYVVADLITGWGVAESVLHYYRLYGGQIAGKRVIVQGWGNVGSAAAYYLAQAGARVVGIIDREGGLLNPDGFTLDQVRQLFLEKKGNQLSAKYMLRFDEIDELIWSAGAEVFLPCAGSRLVTQAQVDALVKGGLEVVASGANVPFADREIFYGPIYEKADSQVAVIPDFIANCGMARAFAFLMQDDAEISDAAIFSDVSRTVAAALERCHAGSSARTGIARTAFENALTELV
ncbi:Glu/Leu/Phe/Val dehydrogenase dimerization domain-containing protein [Variovorax sp. J22P240]|uniref:Glu/Leu/Phe/Val dehydrogenase dimerization domain-containing protein n=1 Tax=unclassified Variovorax TaxID=663243 RepID=UPI0025759AEF|nr:MULTISPECIES: Glu/Leu/Phe/Val dehydrogenase dimerization domain-containing protein [unclassified Variovorax]MDL9998114.1 Glu/Leu/Phe/Val dehydrogenase dimerization domain-containing protein [Variovorax sp. J22P240]MDM0048429.1 Glu/Leu/Phe/Val dehydrogenase dimerization domain-containing protein [Variovorax sp. J22R115]